MLNDNNDEFLPTGLLQDYINNFYGYGSWSISKFWFIGIEEGGGNHKDDLVRRLSSWVGLGKTDLMDCVVYHQKVGSFANGPLLKMHSRTWARLILTKMGFNTVDPTKNNMLNILNNEWGQLNSDNLLIELLPLPSPCVKCWNYKIWVDLDSTLSFLRDRPSYELEVINKRVQSIRSKIAEYHPPVVLFYGKMMQTHWDSIIGTGELASIVIRNYTIRYAKIGNTLYVQCPQPTYIRAYAFWTQLSVKIRQWAS